MKRHIVAAAMVMVVGSLALAPAQNEKRIREVPLDFDPAHPEPIVGWWSNGRELLRLEPNGAYRMWASSDRFKRPVEVGAWRRQNYVFFDLEPYRAKPGTRIRVNMQKDQGVTELVREGMADLRWLPVPPHVLADDMLGAWVAPTEQLLVFENGRYEWRRTVPQSTGITQHEGAWDTDNDVLELGPDSPAVSTQRLRLVRDADGAFALEGERGRLMHPPAAPEPSPSAEPGAGPPSAPPPPAPR